MASLQWNSSDQRHAYLILQCPKLKFSFISHHFSLVFGKDFFHCQTNWKNCEHIDLTSGLCSNSTQVQQVTNFCFWATRKIYFNIKLKCWAPKISCVFSKSTALDLACLLLCSGNQAQTCLKHKKKKSTNRKH